MPNNKALIPYFFKKIGSNSMNNTSDIWPIVILPVAPSTPISVRNGLAFDNRMPAGYRSKQRKREDTKFLSVNNLSASKPRISLMPAFETYPLQEVS